MKLKLIMYLLTWIGNELEKKSIQHTFFLHTVGRKNLPKCFTKYETGETYTATSYKCITIFD